MLSSDGRFVIAFNGEIYNFQELREQLRKEGVQFRTNSDTEVLLEGYGHWGPAVVDRLNGMFAFVIWDRQESLAFGARDRLGIKPLCWAVSKGALIVSSTLNRSKFWAALAKWILSPYEIFSHLTTFRHHARFSRGSISWSRDAGFNGDWEMSRRASNGIGALPAPTIRLMFRTKAH